MIAAMMVVNRKSSMLSIHHGSGVGADMISTTRWLQYCSNWFTFIASPSLESPPPLRLDEPTSNFLHLLKGEEVTFHPVTVPTSQNDVIECIAAIVVRAINC